MARTTRIGSRVRRLLADSDQQGWTLIEMLVVLTIIMILASLALVQYSHSITSAKEAALKSDLFLMRDAIDQYYADKAAYPDSLQTLVSDGYLRAVPKDPFTQSADRWITTQATPAPGSNSADAGIFDVKSGSDMVALDGSRYADW
jgi:general secretion pathway protein G